MSENKYFGYAGQILEVNLSTSKFKNIPLKKKWIDLYVGGVGYATRLLYDLIDKSTDPLSPENPIIVMTGPFTGIVATAPKTAIVSRSPLTGFLGKTINGGSFGIALKKAGYDGVIIRGKAKSPTYISIINGEVKLNDASRLWGMGVFETCNKIKNELGDQKVRIAAIGPAGENLVKISSIISDERRVFGRTGLGAVMGSKMVKAIAVKGNMRIELADDKKLLELNKKYLASAHQTPRGGALKAYGTGGGVVSFAQMGNLPIKNWAQGSWPDAEKISSQTMMQKYKLGEGMKACGDEIFCSIQCERRIKMEHEKYGTSVGKGPEYETIAALGSMLLVNEIEAIIKANDLCDDLGLDTISTGSVIAWAMEAYEKGILTESDIGFKLNWGESEAIMKIIPLIAYKKGIGQLLSEGVKCASSKIGKGSEKFAVHSKGLELPMHNPRLFHTMGLVYAFSNIGASHLQGLAMFAERGVLQPEFGITEVPKDVSSKVKAVIIGQNLCNLIDSLGICKFGVYGIVDFSHFVEAFNSVTGRNETKESLLKIGERIWYLERLLNIKLGLKPEDDSLPYRITNESVPDGAAKGLTFPVGTYFPPFYEAREIDPKTGCVSEKKIKELNLDI
ncbi:MAG: aldehyde ferredoxin oxidoreductase family protein [Nitrososphaeria archaeon]|nr:aldehyde ferredoxin oxidoreductase family protein [Nitrososphaeria archaeon]